MSEHTAQQDGTTSGNGVTHYPAQEDVSAVLAYASAFCGKEHAATGLVREVLAHQRGPADRLTLLADLRRTAYAWTRGSQSTLLRPGFRSWAQRAAETFGSSDTLRRVEHTSLLLAAFKELPEQSRAAVWFCLAERGETAYAARLLSTSEEFAESMALSARARLADAFLRLRAERTEDARCVHYGTMLGAIARGTHRDTPADLRRHLDDCRFCTHDYTVLRALTSGDTEELRVLLVDQVLVWGGPAYREARRTPAERTPAEGRPEPTAGPVRRATLPARVEPEEPDDSAAPPPERPGRRRTVLAVAIAVVLTTVATTAALKLLGPGPATAEAAASPTPSAPAASATPSASPSPSPTSSTGTALATIALDNTGSDRCLAADAGNSSENTPRVAACDGGRTQQWQVVRTGRNTYGLVHVSSTFCLDIAGERVPGDPMQLRPCAYQQTDTAPYPEDQAFLIRTHSDGTFTLVCEDNQDIAVGVSSAGELRMLTTAISGAAVRFELDDDLADALDG